MNQLLSHLIVVPVALPLVTAALLLVLGEKRKRFRPFISLFAISAGLLAAAALLWRVNSAGPAGQIEVYLASNWQAPFGIVLVADRLSALMLVLVSVVGLCAALYAEAGWARAGVSFHALFQIQLMGLNGAFLTGDLFNLFVFFEVTLAASYGLQLHGSGFPRVRSGLHYIAVNLLASSLFLVGLAVLYGVMGTLSMADVAAKLDQVTPRDRGLLHAGVAILALAFLIKAAVWPLNAWLVRAYSAASAPVAAMFALMTKVGVYALLRLWTLFFSGDVGDSAQFGRPALLYGGLATIAFAAIGLMGSLRLDRAASFSIIVSSGTLLAALGVGSEAVTAAALFYLLTATLGVAALFLLVELLQRSGETGQARLFDVDFLPGEDTNLDDEEMPLVGREFSISLAVLGLAFLCAAMLVAGLPPLSGFLAKAALLSALMKSQGGAALVNDLSDPAPAGWWLFGLLLLSGLTATIALARAGIHHLWSAGRRSAPRLKGVEAAAVLALIGACVALTAFAEPVMRYASATAVGLHAPNQYIEAVLFAKARPNPGQSSAEAEASP